MTEVHLREASTSSSSPRVKPSPKPSKISGKFFYAPSDDGTDENLLILLHGLGDTHVPFSKLGKSLKLPQTAILALRAPEQVPFLYEDAWQWYPSFDDLGEPIARPNPTPAIEFLTKTVDYLTGECTWPLERIHLFGFAQGGSVAVEYALAMWKKQLLSSSTKSIASASADAAAVSEAQPPAPALRALGSIVTISGPLLSYPTLSQPCPTPLFVAHRPPPAETALPSTALTAFRKAFEKVTESKMGGRAAAGMPASREEWEPIMRFWSECLGRRQVEGLYEVMSGMSAA
ncbi:hypothetical protein BDN70DRAFT_906467 [Pholiota conissans]|uniref:Phospholipase/carboxylesterase/thioesterase domain-containing protein n=1 Tax=Pholiota conissans TaxID=109636 RepID=A0A9P5Z0L2_9AGAR|nr:hypothetical protein BDN70DRAFT_906467 [Pholiota conissans]